MVDALAEVALLGLGRQLAFLGMMVQTTTVIAPGTRQNGKGEGNMGRSLKPLRDDTLIHAHHRNNAFPLLCPF